MARDLKPAAQKMPTTTCIHCKATIPANVRRCPKCGGEVGTAADLAVCLFAAGLPLGLVFSLLPGNPRAIRLLGLIITAASVIGTAWGQIAISRARRRERERPAEGGRSDRSGENADEGRRDTGRHRPG